MQKCSRVRKGNGVWWKGDFKRDLGLLGWVGIGKHNGGMGPVLRNLTFRRTGSILRSGQLVSILLLVILNYYRANSEPGDGDPCLVGRETCK